MPGGNPQKHTAAAGGQGGVDGLILQLPGVHVEQPPAACWKSAWDGELQTIKSINYEHNLHIWLSMPGVLGSMVLQR